VLEVDQVGAVDAREACRRPVLLELAQRRAQQKAPVLAHDPRIVAVGLREGDRLQAHEPLAAALGVVHRHDVGAGGGALGPVTRRRGLGRLGPAHVLLHAPERRLEALAGDRLDQEVQGLDLERLDRGVGVAGEEDDRGRIGEAPQQARQGHALDLGHRHVEEERVVAAARQVDEGLLGRRGRGHALDGGRGLQEALDVGQRTRLVVDGEDRQA
jgi:hypothetical protein